MLALRKKCSHPFDLKSLQEQAGSVGEIVGLVERYKFKEVKEICDHLIG